MTLEELKKLGAKPVPPSSLTRDQLLALGGKSVDPEREQQAKPDKVAPYGLSGLVKGERAPDEAVPVASEQRGPVETFIRKASSAVSSNFVNPISAKITSAISGQPYDEALKGINESDASAAQDNPKAATAGTVAGIGLQLAAPLGGAAKGAGAASRALAAAKVGAGFGAAQGAGDALTAGGDAVDALAAGAKGGGSGALFGGALGAGTAKLGQFLGAAPERVNARVLSNLARGEAGGAAKTKSAADMIAKAGPDGEKLIKVLDDTGIKEGLSVKAAAKPAAALKDVERVLEHNETHTLGPVYAAIDKAGTGPDVTTLGTHLLDHADALRAKGQPEIAEAVERYTNFLDRNYKAGVTLSGSVLRKLKGSIGSGAFQNLADENTPLGAQVKREIYGVYSRAVEDAAAATPGVDVAALKLGNERASHLLDAAKVLSERVAKAATGGSTLSNAIAQGTHKTELVKLLGEAITHGQPLKVAGVLTSEAAHQTMGRVPQVLRRADLTASHIEQAIRKGDKGAALAREILSGASVRGGAGVVGSKKAKKADEEDARDD